MEIINKKTKESYDLRDINSFADLVFAKYKHNKRATDKLTSIIIPRNEVVTGDMIRLLWDYMQTLPEWVDWISKDNYKDWPTEEEDIEVFDKNYRIYLTSETISMIASDVRYKDFINKVYSEISTMKIRVADETGKYIYLTRFDTGDPFILKYLFNAEFELNPYKEDIEPIDFTNYTEST